MINKKNNNNIPSFSKIQPPPPKIILPQSKNTNIPSLGNTLMEGLAFGTGSSIAKNTIDNILKDNSLNTDINHKKHNDGCSSLFDILKSCLERENSVCDNLIEEYNKKCLESKNI